MDSLRGGFILPARIRAEFAAVALDLRCQSCKIPLQIRVHAKGL